MRASLQLLALAGGLVLAPPAAAARGAFARAPVSDTSLAGMRGGFILPGGLDVAMTIQTATQLNGRLLFRTVLTADKGPAELAVSDRSRDLGVTIGGGAVRTSGGRVEALPDRGGARITYSGRGLDVSHLAGAVNGSIIANQRNGVTIDTSTMVNLALRNATPLNLGSTMLRVDGMAVDAGTRLSN